MNNKKFSNIIYVIIENDEDGEYPVAHYSLKEIDKEYKGEIGIYELKYVGNLTTTKLTSWKFK